MNDVIVYFRDFYTKVGDNIDVLPIVMHEREILSYGSRVPNTEVFNNHRVKSFPSIITNLLFSTEGKVIHVFCGLNWTVPFIILAAACRKRRIIYSPLGQLLPEATKRKNYLKQLIINTLYSCSFSKVDVWHVVSQHEANAISKFRDQYSEVFLKGLPLHSDLNFRSRTKQELGNTFLFFGRFDIWQKGLDIMLFAFSNNRRILKELKYKIIVAGRASESEINVITDLIRKMELEKLVQIEANVSDERRKELYSSSTFFIHPSRVEGFARSMRDAICAGIPIITTHDSNAADLVLSENIGWVSECRTEQLSKIIESATLLDGVGYTAKVNACIKMKTQYSADKYAASLIKLYDLQKTI